jgi:transposase
VAKAHRDLALRPTGKRGAVTNEETGIAALVARLQAAQPTLMVLEATGGDHRAMVAALATAAWPLVVSHPRQVRDCANATGPWANTDVLEARAVAHFAEAVRPAPRPDAQTEERRARRARRRPRMAMRTAAQNRLANAPRCLRADIEAYMAWLNQRMAALDDDLDTPRRASPVWRERATVDRSVPGLGPVGARTLVLDLPAWGPWSRQRIAALVGVAPCTRDSGPRRGTRTTWGGRAHVRATLDLSTRVAVRYTPVLKRFDERLHTAGNVAKVALTACMRKRLTILKARVKHQKPWHVQEVPSA